MRLPIGTRDVSASGGTVELLGRRGEAWSAVADQPLTLERAIALLDDGDHGGAHQDPIFDDAVPSAQPNAARFAPGQTILWRYGRHIETARVIRDDADGLVAWIPVGSARLEPAPVGGRHPRDIPLDERFLHPWEMREQTWTGRGIVRVAPADRPWSVWFFRAADGTPQGAYINLELPHRRVLGDDAAVFTRDLVLDLWVDAAHPGAEDIWLKDADELVAAQAQGRFTAEQVTAVRTIADRAVEEFVSLAAWPLDDGWDLWDPDPAMDAPLALPDRPSIARARRRAGATSLVG